MFIDIHVHTRDYAMPTRPNGNQPYTRPEQLIEIYDAIGVEKAVLLPGVSPECCIVPQSNQEILQVCEKYPGRFIPFCNVDPRSVSNSPDAPLDQVLRWYKDQGFKGVGEITANLSFDNPMVKNLFKHCETVGLPLTFHIGPRIGGCYGLFDEPGLPLLDKALREFPGLILLGHSQPFWSEIGEIAAEARRGYPKGPVIEGAVPKLMRRYPNLHGDLSAGSGCNALSRDPDYGARFLEEFQDRLYFGTDICAPPTATPPLVNLLIEWREEKRISEAVFQKVARENAAKLLGLA